MTERQEKIFWELYPKIVNKQASKFVNIDRLDVEEIVTDALLACLSAGIEDFTRASKRAEWECIRFLRKHKRGLPLSDWAVGSEDRIIDRVSAVQELEKTQPAVRSRIVSGFLMGEPYGDCGKEALTYFRHDSRLRASCLELYVEALAEERQTICEGKNSASEPCAGYDPGGAQPDETADTYPLYKKRMAEALWNAVRRAGARLNKPPQMIENALYAWYNDGCAFYGFTAERDDGETVTVPRTTQYKYVSCASKYLFGEYKTTFCKSGGKTG